MIPDLSNPQSWNRYSYVTNRPVNFNDPTGHDPNHDKCDYYGHCKLETYTLAGIATESPISGANTRPRWLVGLLGGDRYTSIGPAKVTDAQMEGPAGEYIKDENGNERGVGLGLRTEKCDFSSSCGFDQDNTDVARIAMQKRISLRMNACESQGCSPTDMLLVSALGADEYISPQDIKAARKNYLGSGSVTLDWASYLSAQKPDNKKHDLKLIQMFTNNVIRLGNKGYDVPDIDWDYVSSLST